MTTEMLTKAFAQYRSFTMARVVCNKFTKKSKGYGFVSFMDPADAIRAIREMNRA